MKHVEGTTVNETVVSASDDRVEGNVPGLTTSACADSSSYDADENDRYWEIEDSVARDKVAAVFRDLLSHKYKSSSKNKVKARRRKQMKQATASNAEKW